MLLKIISDGKTLHVAAEGKTLCAVKRLVFSREAPGSEAKLEIEFDREAVEADRAKGFDVRESEEGFFYLPDWDFNYLAAQIEVAHEMEKEGLLPPKTVDDAAVFSARLCSHLEEIVRHYRQRHGE